MIKKIICQCNRCHKEFEPKPLGVKGSRCADASGNNKPIDTWDNLAAHNYLGYAFLEENAQYCHDCHQQFLQFEEEFKACFNEFDKARKEALKQWEEEMAPIEVYKEVKKVNWLKRFMDKIK